MYLTLYRKYRPQEFDAVAGESEIMKTLRNSLKENRMAHAYIFTGPRGVGKTTTARLIAKGLNCLENGITDSPCNECANCKAIENGSFYDLIEIDAASNRGIDEIRGLKEKVNYKPAQGRKKVYIIDEVHMLTKEAFNALLKTLEEPPEFVIFILATTEPDKILDTILSRCQRYDFLPLTKEEVKEKLSYIAENEKIDAEEEVYRIIYDKCGGSMRDAISIFEKVIAYNLGEKITANKCEKALGVISKKKVYEFGELILKENKNDIFKFIDLLWNEGLEIEEFLKEYVVLLKQEIVENKGNIEKKCEIIEIIYDMLFKFKFEEDKRMLGYLIILKILKGNSSDSANVIINDTYKSQSVVIEKINNEVKIEKNAVSFNEIFKNWKIILNNAKERKISLFAFLSMAKPSKLEGNTLIIEFPKENSYHKVSMEKNENLNILKDVLREMFHETINIKFEVTGVSGIKNDSSTIVKSVVDFFEGELIK